MKRQDLVKVIWAHTITALNVSLDSNKEHRSATARAWQVSKSPLRS